MVIDGSALMAIVLDKTDAAELVDILVDAPVRRMSTVTWLEAALIIEERGGRIAALRFDEWVRAAAIELGRGLAERSIRLARTAWRHFGATRHSNRLNYGDCLAYALAKTLGETLLFRSAAFLRTDIEPAA